MKIYMRQYYHYICIDQYNNISISLPKSSFSDYSRHTVTAKSLYLLGTKKSHCSLQHTNFLVQVTVEVADFSYAVSVVSESDFLDVQNNSKCSDMDHHIGLNLKKSGLNESDLGRNITDLGEHKNTLF